VIPLKDLTPRRSFPVVTLLLITVNVVVFLHQISLTPSAGDVFVRTYGLVPAKISLALAGRHYTMTEALLPFVTCMFLHGGFLHIVGNLWFLWVFGANVEDRLGSLPYLLFYFAAGIGSGIAQTLFSWGSRVPSIGASGAISGVLGAYVVFFPASRILTLVPLLIIWFTWRIPAVIFIGLWFAVQFLSGISSLGSQSVGGVAWWAHVGGFLIGVVVALMVRSASGPPRRASALYS
jgi:membrane associated rhomboid family serine protease